MTDLVRVGINGFGRIGRTFCRAAWSRSDSGIEVVAANDIQPAEQLAYLFEYDSIAGRWPDPVQATANELRAGDRTLRLLTESEPERLPWSALGVDVVIESSRRFAPAEQARRHLDAGASLVIVSAPSTGADATFVVGVNDDTFDPAQHRVVSNASCTTNCLAPMAHVLDRAFGIEHGLVTTVHAYTSDQALVDGAGGSWRDGRAAALNIIPTSTGAARAISLVLPHLAGRLQGGALRVPVADGSLTDLTVMLTRPSSAQEINDAFREAAAGELAGIIEYSDRPLVSADIVGTMASCVFDAPLTVSEGGLVKVFGWYDNEWGYSNRLVDLAANLGRRRSSVRLDA
jgi:glyceraldehyde 3-phosphate dehydrogenase